jgi:hypothetical protein
LQTLQSNIGTFTASETTALVGLFSSDSGRGNALQTLQWELNPNPHDSIGNERWADGAVQTRVLTGRTHGCIARARGQTRQVAGYISEGALRQVCDDFDKSDI